MVVTGANMTSSWLSDVTGNMTSSSVAITTTDPYSHLGTVIIIIIIIIISLLL